MTSKLDTAGLVERLRAAARAAAKDWNENWAVDGDSRSPDEMDEWRAAGLIEAFTQAAAPDMEPVAWQSKLGPAEKWVNDPLGFNAELRAESEAAGAQWRPLYSASQLSALQERVERAEQQRDELISLGKRGADLGEFWKSRAEAAEARVAELETLIQNNGSAKLIKLSGAALAHKGEGR